MDYNIGFEEEKGTHKKIKDEMLEEFLKTKNIPLERQNLLLSQRDIINTKLVSN